MKTKNTILFLTVLFAVVTQQLVAQEEADSTVKVLSTYDIQVMQQDITGLKQKVKANKPGESRFLLRGYAHVGLSVSEDEFTFDGGSFNPLFIYKQSDRLLFESEFDIEFNGADVEIGLEYVNASYLLTKNITVRAGKFLVPFGIFVPNLHPAWINKFPGGPLGAGHDGILPSGDIGVELRGGSHIGTMKFNYSVYVVNGAQLNDGSEEPDEAGKLHYSIFPDNNRAKSFGGRLGIFPFTNSSLELGVSLKQGKVGNEDSELENIEAFHYAFDLSYVKTIPRISSIIDVKGQYAAINVDKATYPDHEVPDDVISFDNSSTTWFAQVALRPALIENKFFRNLELAARFSSLKTPEGSGWEADNTKFDIGLNYWIDWRTAIKISYGSVKEAKADQGDPGEPGHGGGVGNTFYIHWAIGF
jgi:hypothetical protein